MPKTTLGSQYNGTSQLRSAQTSSYSGFAPFRSRMAAQYNAHGVIVTRLLASEHRVLQEGNRVIYARNAATGVVTKLGEIAEGATTLVDAALADGFYDIEVRTSGNFWEEARSRVSFSVEIVGGVVGVFNIPSIRELTVEITRGFSTKLRWKINDGTFVPGLKFGIWRSATTPVDVSGAPDFETPGYQDLGKYSFTLTQTADEYFAVAAIVDPDQGAEQEIFHTWDLTPPSSPPNQFGYDNA